MHFSAPIHRCLRWFCSGNFSASLRENQMLRYYISSNYSHNYSSLFKYKSAIFLKLAHLRFENSTKPTIRLQIALSIN